MSATTSLHQARTAVLADALTSACIDLDNLKKWKPPPSPEPSADEKPTLLSPIQSAFVEGFSSGECLNHTQSKFMGASVLRPNVEWKQILVRIVDKLNQRKKVVVTVQSPDESQGIIIDLLTSALEPNVPDVSFTNRSKSAKSANGKTKGNDENNDDKENEEEEEEQEEDKERPQYGPVIPCRVMFSNRADENIMQHVFNLGRLLQDKGEECETLQITLNSMETMQLAIKYFKDASRKIAPKCKERFRASAKSYDGAFELSFLYVPKVEGSVKLDKMPCDNPGCTKNGTKKCSKCRTPYCSRECQVASWNNGHKDVCESRARGEHPNVNGPTTSNRESVLLDPKARIPGPWGEQESRLTISVDGRTRTFKPGKDRVMYRDHEFIVKVQGPVGPNPGCGILMIYDEKRTFTMDVDGQSGPGKRVFAFTKSLEKPNASPAVLAQMGFHPELPPELKCYLYARTEENGLRIFIDKLAPWQKW